MSPTAGRYSSFVIRVWNPESREGVLQGQITHVATREMLRFRDPQQMVAFIVARSQSQREPSVACDEEPE